MKFSIIIVTFNRKKTLLSCLHSIKKQAPSFSYEVIVVLNGDLAYLDKYRSLFPQFNFFHIPYTTTANARNFAVDMARGEYVLFLKEDCVLPEDYFNKVHFDRQWDVLGGPDQYPEEASSKERLIGRALASPLCMGGAYKRHSKKASYDFCASEDNLNIANLWFKRGLFVQEGHKFDKTLYKNESYDLLVKLASLKKAFHYDPNLMVYHQRSRSLERLSAAIIKSGKSRCQNLILRPKKEKIFYLFPLCFLLFFIFMVFHPNKTFVALVLSYIGAIGLYELLNYQRLSVRFALLHFLIQFSFAIGSIQGIWLGVEDYLMTMRGSRAP